MATTLCSLHILDAKPEDISPLLNGGDVIRTINAPWLSVLHGAATSPCPMSLT